MEIPHTITFNHTLPFIVGSGRYKAVGELPSHNHNGSTNNTGNHTHKIYRGNNGSGGAYVSAGQIYPLRQGAITDPDISGSHGHTVIIDNTGGGNAHNSMQPYLSVFMWQRTQ